MFLFFNILLVMASVSQAWNGNADPDNNSCPVDPNRCFLPPVTGTCRGCLPRFYYDSTSNRCKKFIYGGCGGNDNRFETIRECRDACVPGTDNPCYAPPESGLCDASFARFYYDADVGKCKKFIWGGCGGNGNRFESVDECLRTCGSFR